MASQLELPHERHIPRLPHPPIHWLALAGPPEEAAWQAVFAAHPQALPARVVEQHRTGYVVADTPEASLKAESLPEWQRPRFPSHERAAVGDWC